jgi:ketosteroid isomerase-like protein
METESTKIVRAAYDAYNARDDIALLAFVTDDVSWPDGTTDDKTKRLFGREPLRAYWLKQWAVSQTHDTPVEVTELPDGRVKVKLDQVVTTLDGGELSRGSFEYFFELRDKLISRLDITYL